jgi:hypothetical protein
MQVLLVVSILTALFTALFTALRPLTTALAILLLLRGRPQATLQDASRALASAAHVAREDWPSRRGDDDGRALPPGPPT